MSLRKSNSSSHIPIRRSNSSSNIPRLSRPMIRQSAVRNSRSSSARPSTISNLLACPSGTLGRSSSYSNLLTPSQRISCATPTSVSSTSKNPKMNDKDWTKTQLQKVKSFLHHQDPEMPPLKPLTIRVYVHSMDLLFKMLDARISITLNNYKESVPDYLKIIKYPYQLKPSVIKSPAVPSSWQYILQIWIWFVDFLELLRNSEKVLYPLTADHLSLKLFYTSLHHMANQFNKFNKGSEELDPVKANEELINILATIYNFDYINAKALTDEEAYLDAQCVSLKQLYENANTELIELKRNIDERTDSNAQFLNEKVKRRENVLIKLRELHVKNKNLQISVMQEKETSENLKSIVSKQPCTKYDLDCAKKKVAELNHTSQLKEDRLRKQNEQIAENNIKVTQERELLESMVYKTNDKIGSLSCEGYQLQQLKLSENDLSRVDLLDHLKCFAEKKKMWDLELEKKFQVSQGTLQQKEQENRIDTLKVEALKLELRKLEQVENEQIAAQEEYRANFNKVSKEHDLEFKQTEKEFALLRSQRPHADEMERQLDASRERKEKLRCTVNDTMVKGEDFFVSIYNSIKKSMETQQEILLGINKSVEAAQDVDIEKLNELLNEI